MNARRARAVAYHVVAEGLALALREGITAADEKTPDGRRVAREIRRLVDRLRRGVTPRPRHRRAHRLPTSQEIAAIAAGRDR